MDVDVLIVGAGPAGCGAAKAAASAGAKTLVVDRKKEIGTPVQCGEVIGLDVLSKTDLTIPPTAICGKQTFTRFVADRSMRIDNHSTYWQSLTVERKIFDKHLAYLAARAGAIVQADCRLVDMEMRDGDVSRVTLRHQGKDVLVRPKVVIAADGVHSTVSKLMKRPDYQGEDLARGVEYELVAKKRLPPCMQIFIEPEIGLGYGWIIPKGAYRANVGLGLVGRAASRREFLMDWITQHPIVSQYFDVDRVLEVKTGDAPVPGFEGGPVKGNVLFAGDAAGQTLAFVGEGIMPSYICGSVAGDVAAKARTNKDLSIYDGEVRSVIGAEMELGTDLRDALVLIWTLAELDGSMRSMISSLVMNELIKDEDMAMLDSLPDKKDLMDMVRERVRESGRPIRMTRVR